MRDSLWQLIKQINQHKNIIRTFDHPSLWLINIHRSNYSRIESGQMEISVDALNKVARYFVMTIDQIVNFDGDTPQEVTTEDKTLMEQVKMFLELESEEESRIFKMVDTFLNRRRKPSSFRKNVA